MSSSDVGTAPLYFSTVKIARSNAARPRSFASLSIRAPVPPGYAWNCRAGASPLPSAKGGMAGGWKRLNGSSASGIQESSDGMGVPCARADSTPNELAAAATSE